MAPERAVVALALRRLRRAAALWALGFAVLAVATARSYTALYKTPAERARVAALVGRNPAFQAIYGQARHLDTPGGFTAWRVGGSLAVLAAVWALLSATRLLRGEEDDGRTEVVRSGAVTAAGVSAASLVALLLLCAALGAATFLGCAVGSLAVGGSALLGLAVALCAAWFTAVGALASQVMDTRRRAAALSGALVVVAFGVRVAADGSHAGGALRWASPLGWAELSQPFEGGEWLPLALLAISAAAIAGIAVAFASRRDLGAGLAADSAARTPRLALLGSPAAYAARSSIASTAGWALALGAFGVLIGTLARDVAAFARTSAQLGRFGSRLGAGALVHPSAYVGLTYAFLVVPLAVQHVLSLGTATDGERRGRLDLVLAGAVSRPTWLMGTALVAATQVVVIALTLGVGIWAGGAARHAGLGFGAVIGGALNCLPAVALFGGVCVFATGFLPRVAVASTMALLGASYVVQVIGASTRVPRWVLDASPFHHVAAMPGVGANWGGAVGLLVAGGVLALLGVAGFARRDVVTG